MDLMTQPELLKGVKGEHKERLEGQTYEPVGDPNRRPSLEMAREMAEKLKGKD